MRLLIDVTHPSLAHVFRPLWAAWTAEGHECAVVARDKDVTLELLRGFGIPHVVLATLGRTQLGRARELVAREARMLALARRLRPHLVIGTSAHAARVGLWVGAKSAVLNDDDAAAVPLFRWLSYPFASAIITPSCLAHEGHGRRHLTYPSYHALFYLHPARFVPDPRIRAELGLPDGGRFGIVRLSALAAHHDTGVRGLTESLVARLRRDLPADVRLFVTSEKPLSAELRRFGLPVGPARLHHAVALADFVLGDSQTMTAEAAVLGVPAFRVNDFVGRISYLRELEGYGLAFGFRPGEEEKALAAVQEVVRRSDRREVFAERRRRMLAERIDPLPWLLDQVRALVGPEPALERPA
jgi:predicted glycosyltransferase